MEDRRWPTEECHRHVRGVASRRADRPRRRVRLMHARTPRMRRGAIATLALSMVFVLAACGSGSTATSGTATNAPATNTPATAPASAAAASPPASAAAATKHVAILNKDMTDDEIKAAIAQEGTLTVGNWTYAATAEIVNQFQKYVKDTYGADIKLNYVGTQQPSEYLTKLAADAKAGNKASFDVIAVEENYWYEASQQGLVDDPLTSDLIPNQKLVLD